MTHHDTRITEYMLRHPETRSAYVAGIFGVETTHVCALRKKAGAHAPRNAAAIARNVKAADLDDMILTAVYRRGLVDSILGPVPDDARE